MKVKRYKSINVISGSSQIDYELPVITFGESIVDKSGFVPIADAVKGLTAGNRAHVDDGNSYDFADGKDNGMDVSFRRPGIDIAQAFQESYKGQMELVNAAKDGSERLIRRTRANANHGVVPSSDNSTSGD